MRDAIATTRIPHAAYAGRCAVRAIPPGETASYGEIAERVGLRSPRLVGRILAEDGHDLPWHRVLGAGGRLSLALGTPSGDEQRARLRAEGVNVANNRVDMARHGWRPMEHSG